MITRTTVCAVHWIHRQKAETRGRALEGTAIAIPSVIYGPHRAGTQDMDLNKGFEKDLFRKCTVDGKKKSPPRDFGHNSRPRALIGTRIGGNASYQPPGAP